MTSESKSPTFPNSGNQTRVQPETFETNATSKTSPTDAKIKENAYKLIKALYAPLKRANTQQADKQEVDTQKGILRKNSSFPRLDSMSPDIPRMDSDSSMNQSPNTKRITFASIAAADSATK